MIRADFCMELIDEQRIMRGKKQKTVPGMTRSNGKTKPSVPEIFFPIRVNFSQQWSEIDAQKRSKKRANQNSG